MKRLRDHHTTATSPDLVIFSSFVISAEHEYQLQRGCFYYMCLNNDSLNMSLFNFFWSVEKDDANPANIGMIGLVKSV